MISTSFPITQLDVTLYQQFPKSKKWRITFSIFFIFFFIIYIILQFFALTGIVQITIQSIYFKWISLSAKDEINLILCLLEIFSDFGMFLFFILIVVYIVYDFFNFVKSIFFNPDVYKEAAKIKHLDANLIQDIDYDEDSLIIPHIYSFLLYLLIFSITFIITICISQYSFAVNAYSFESIIIFVVFSLLLFNALYQIAILKCTMCIIRNENKKNNRTSDSDQSFLSQYEQQRTHKLKNQISDLYNLYNNSKPHEFIVLKEDKNDSNMNNQIQININDGSIYDKENIKFSYIWYGVIFCIFKSSNLLKITILNGMFEKEENEVTQINENNTTLNDPLLSSQQANDIDHSQNDSNNDQSVQKSNDDKKCNKKCDCHQRSLFYKIFISFLIIAMQISYYIFLGTRNAKPWKDIIGVFIIRLLLLPKILAYNIIDFFIHPKKVWNSFKEIVQKVVFVVLLIYYFFMIILLIVNSANPYKFSKIKSATFIENNSMWFKNNQNQTFSPESFCYIESPMSDLHKTEDFAMLTTLPRLYSFTQDGKCYIKPSMRGLFNSSMKYIFGKNYEQDEIYIFCKKMSHYPFLVITSDKILNATLNHFSNDNNITILDKQFNITNKDYFQENPDLTNLPEIGQQLLFEYQNCTKQYGTERCEYEWDAFTQYYWPNIFNDSFVNISGFEKYQISIDSEFVFQPNFITSNGKLMSGTHYIVGGSFEDSWGISFLIEAISRKYTPIIFEVLIPLYKLIRNIWKEVFIQLEYLNRMMIFSEPIIEPGIKILSELYSQFNFSHEALFTVGHSVGGTLMKGISYYTDIRGIAFESSDAENTVAKELDPKFSISKSSTNKIVNIYSQKNKFSGMDDDSYINVGFIKGFWVPSVYKTACLTAITCSETMKYVPFCKQSFSYEKSKSEKEFNDNLNAYLNQYGLQ